MSRNPPRPASSTVMRELAPYMTVGSQLTLTVLLFTAIGWWLDERWATSPLITGIGAGVGAAIGLANLIRSLVSLSKTRTQHQREEQPAIPTEK